jgi:hypothetical protein
LVVVHVSCFSWIYFIAILASFNSSIVTATSCKFLLLGSSRSGYGLFRYEDEYQSCATYSKEFKVAELDLFFHLARFFAVVNATLTGLAGILWILWHFCYPKRRDLWKLIRVLLYLSLWASGSTFLMAESEMCVTNGYDCVVGIGGIGRIINILNLILLTLLGLSPDVLTAQTPSLVFTAQTPSLAQTPNLDERE